MGGNGGGKWSGGKEDSQCGGFPAYEVSPMPAYSSAYARPPKSPPPPLSPPPPQRRALSKELSDHVATSTAALPRQTPAELITSD